MKRLKFIGLVLLLLCMACKQKKAEMSTHRTLLDASLAQAGENEDELRQVLDHYADDSCKRAAAEFLITNMPFQMGVEDYLISPRNEKYYPDITCFDGPEAVRAHCDSLRKAGYRYMRTPRYDLHQIDADYLIRHIDLAFEVWQKPWAKEVAFDDFCRYILPYRSMNEPLADLRRTLRDKYVPLLDSAGVRTALDACHVLNGQLKQDIRYAATGHPLSSTVEETMRSGTGECNALCNYTVLAMRAAGIPVVVHQTVWTRMDRGHVWPAVLSEGRFHDFDPGGSQTDVYPGILYGRGYLRPAKVYRRAYDKRNPQADSLYNDGYATFLKNPLVEDVTAEMPATPYTLRIPLDGTQTGCPGAPLYLCSFNYYSWQPIALGSRDADGQTAVFANVYGRNFFVVAEAANNDGRLTVVSRPVCTYEDGRIHELHADTLQPVRHTFNKPTPGKPYLLSYWDEAGKHWKDVACESSTDSTHTVAGIPSGALLFLRTEQIQDGNRVGFIDNKGTYWNTASW